MSVNEEERRLTEQLQLKRTLRGAARSVCTPHLPAADTLFSSRPASSAQALGPADTLCSCPSHLSLTVDGVKVRIHVASRRLEVSPPGPDFSGTGTLLWHSESEREGALA